MSGSSGGTTTQIIQPTPPPAPSTAEAIQQYVQSLPALYAAQLQYAPQEAAQQVSLAQQYAAPLAQAYQTAQNVLYPGTAGLQESLAAQAQAGMTAQVPDSIRQQYRSDLLGQLGTNASSGIGADYVSRNLINQQQQYNQYYQNLGLSLAGRQPLANPTTPNYTNQLGNYQPGQGLQYTSGNYGTFAQAGRPLVTQNQQGTPNWIAGLQAGGSVLQGIGSIGTASALGGFGGCWVAAELFDGWEDIRTYQARFFIFFRAPRWFRFFYANYGKTIASFIKDKPMLKAILRPLFSLFATKGKEVIHG